MTTYAYSFSQDPLACEKIMWIMIDTLFFLCFQINGLAQRYPGLMSLRSVDLSPASWMSVAWYFPFSHKLLSKLKQIN